MPSISKISPCLWCGTRSEEAALSYVPAFAGGSHIVRI